METVFQENIESIPVTWGKAVRIWWAIAWRAFLTAVVIGFIVGFIVGFVLGFILALLGAPFEAIGGIVMLVSFILNLFIGFFITIFFFKQILNKDFGDFKIMLVRSQPSLYRP